MAWKRSKPSNGSLSVLAIAAQLLFSLSATEAQSLALLPTCAVSCYNEAIPSSCNLDPTCICESSTFISSVTCCVAGACSASDIQAANDYLNSVCNVVGVYPVYECTASGATTAYATTSGTSAASSNDDSLATLSSGASAAAGTLSSESSITSSSPTRTNSISSIAVPTGTASSETHPQSTGLSTGAKAGIGVGAGLGAVCLVGFAFWLGKRQKKPKSTSGAIGQPISEADPIVPVAPLYELSSKTTSNAAELPSPVAVPELYGDEKHRAELSVDEGMAKK